MNHPAAFPPKVMSDAAASPFMAPSSKLLRRLTVAIFAALPIPPSTAGPIAPAELKAPKFEISGNILRFTIHPSAAGRGYQLQHSETLSGSSWQNLGEAVSGDGNDLVITTPRPAGSHRRFYRLGLSEISMAPEGFVLIPPGNFQMGDQSSPLVGSFDERPAHSVQVSGFYLGKFEVTKSEWDTVLLWATNHGYTDLPTGSGKAANHPVHTITWFNMVKWCNARSEMDNLTPCYRLSGETYRTGESAPTCDWSASGYRLPTEAEWEKGARGGLTGKNFPWGDSISHGLANFTNSGVEPYQTGTTGAHPAWSTDNDPNLPDSSPVGSFTANGYGLYDMAGNMWERCWDFNREYTSAAETDPRGGASGSYRAIRGGAWFYAASDARVSRRGGNYPGDAYDFIGFRVARSIP
jgi:formylglycine-generating enzyme